MHVTAVAGEGTTRHVAGQLVLVENDKHQPVALFKELPNGSIYFCSRGEPRFDELLKAELSRGVVVQTHRLAEVA